MVLNCGHGRHSDSGREIIGVMLRIVFVMAIELTTIKKKKKLSRMHNINKKHIINIFNA